MKKDRFYVESEIPGKISDVFKFWFDPPQAVPPLKEFREVNFTLGGHFEAILQPPGGEEISIYGTFRDIVLNKRIVCEWNMMGQFLTLTLEFTDIGGEKTFVHVSQTDKGGEFNEMQKQMVAMYFTCMKAIFQKLDK